MQARVPAANMPALSMCFQKVQALKGDLALWNKPAPEPLMQLVLSFVLYSLFSLVRTVLKLQKHNGIIFLSHGTDDSAAP